ncbi:MULTISPECIES: family 43 glycosylhydrolase [Streptomyces]|uniref:family 43 glycosylhydrolase n=1 Tax=Streptomyces TaxID=1883 RepID=UPI0005EE03D2|nr:MULTISPECIES: family 43 glycosylhydrolase [unclassified Streptomyces]UJV47163.1 1,4-beta-xylanase [Streptomyces sp. AMCC400023]SFM60334.1 Beta-xylosidase [Streptomyces sp. cf124]
MQDYAGYVFVYFTGEDSPEGERIRFALSRGDDPLRWRELNGGAPLLTSDLGTGGLRDPFLVRDPDGDRFHLIATDLRMHGEPDGDWDRVQRTGSTSLMVWESTDLVRWTDRRLVRVAPDTAGNVWAPEACYDPELGAFVVFWASKLYAEDDPEHTADTHNRMLYATTRDFRVFSEPRLWNDPGHSVIDSTVVRHDDAYYRFTKDERGNSPAAPGGKFITVEKSKGLRDTSYDFVADRIGHGAVEQGEGPIVFRSNTDDRTWYLFVDEFSGRGYVPFETTDLDSGTWTPCAEFALPPGARHGSVLPVTRAEYERLLTGFAPPASVVDVHVPEGLKAYALVDDVASKVVLPVHPETELGSLAPEFDLSAGSRIEPASGTPLDFHTPQRYTVTTADGTSRTWTVEAVAMRSPLLPGLYADPNIQEFHGRYYVYPTTDGFEGWGGTRFEVFSSDDLVTWENHGVVLDLESDVSWADRHAWAPAAAERDGSYYFYFCADQQIGVAVSDSPTGPFRDALGRPLIARDDYPGQMIDPAVFTDGDGTAYLYWGNTEAYGVPLDADMVSFDPARVRRFTPEDFREGAFVVERRGVYYYMWSEDDTRSEDYRVAYATGPTPLGPWTEKGVILRKRPEYGILATGHHTVVNVPGTDDWFICYHRFAIPGPGTPRGDGVRRESTLDRLVFAADGSIEEVVPTLESIDPVVSRD